MVSFSCEVCNDTIKKPKLDAHKGKCHGAYFTCLDCNTTFNDGEHKSHTSCISEAQKYQSALYKPEKGKGKGKGKGNKNGQEANGKPSNPATPVEKENPESEDRDIEMTDAAPAEVPAVGESSEDDEEIPTKKDNAEKREKARKHKKERRERKKEAKKKAAERAKEESRPTEKPTATVTKPNPVDSTEETPTTERFEKKSEKKDKKSKKDRKAKKDEPKAATEVPKVGKAAAEAAVKAVVTGSKPIDTPEAPAAAKKSEKKEKKSKAGEKRKLDEAVSEPTNGITEAPETAPPAAETKPEESPPTKKTKKEELSLEDKDLAESFLAIFQEGYPLTLGEALTRLEKEHDGDAQKRLLEIIRLKKVKGELVVSIP